MKVKGIGNRIGLHNKNNFILELWGLSIFLGGLGYWSTAQIRAKMHAKGFWLSQYLNIKIAS